MGRAGERAELTDRIGQLDRRRSFARLRAPIWFGFSMFVIALVWAAGILVGFAMLARAWSLVTGQDIEDVALWGWAPEVVAGVVVLLVLAVFLALVQAGARGVDPKVVAPLGSLTEPDPRSRVANVLTELAIGLGVEPPSLRLLDDPAPNSLSLPLRRWGPTIVLTSGTEALARDELEAMLAHELVHLHAPDARWAAAAMWGLARLRAAGYAVMAIGGFLAVAAIGAFTELSLFLPTPFLGGVALLVLGWVAERLVDPVGRRLRHDADRLADVGTVHLARHPDALARLCDHLAADERRVGVSANHLDHLWFEEVTESTGAARDELIRRAADARAQASTAQPDATD